jgi:hypothetical protein
MEPSQIRKSNNASFLIMNESLTKRAEGIKRTGDILVGSTGRRRAEQGCFHGNLMVWRLSEFNFMVDVAANCRKVVETIREVAARCGREPDGVRLLAASKSQPVEAIQAAFDAGIRLFGENYVQEAREKKKALGATARSTEWHMIGHLQRNKVRAAMDLFSTIQSLGSVQLVRSLDEEGKRRKMEVRALVEVNLAGEESKSGISEQELIPLLERVGEMVYLRVQGLMTVPPFHEDPEEARPYFRRLKELQMEIKDLKIPNVELRELSMGMTHDYPVAIEEGATMVRVGTAIFGERGK